LLLASYLNHIPRRSVITRRTKQISSWRGHKSRYELLVCLIPIIELTIHSLIFFELYCHMQVIMIILCISKTKPLSIASPILLILRVLWKAFLSEALLKLFHWRWVRIYLLFFNKQIRSCCVV
jgi:hypothetical protein